KESAVKKELKKLEGIWLPVAYESGGEKVEGKKFKKETDLANSVLTIRGDKSREKLKDGSSLEATLKIDPTAKPKTMDFTYTEGQAKGRVSRSIYELNGDTLKICTTFENDKVRPK